MGLLFLHHSTFQPHSEFKAIHSSWPEYIVVMFGWRMAAASAELKQKQVVIFRHANALGLNYDICSISHVHLSSELEISAAQLLFASAVVGTHKIYANIC